MVDGSRIGMPAGSQSVEESSGSRPPVDVTSHTALIINHELCNYSFEL